MSITIKGIKAASVTYYHDPKGQVPCFIIAECIDSYRKYINRKKNFSASRFFICDLVHLLIFNHPQLFFFFLKSGQVRTCHILEIVGGNINHEITTAK